MKTYPIFEATFGGSDDYMAQPTVRIAAVNITQAVRKFREWDRNERGLCGTVGNLVYRDERFGWIRPSAILAEHIRRNTEIRATRPNWFSVGLG